jgi:unsaturated chondroitin disaccharide hydrolase
MPGIHPIELWLDRAVSRIDSLARRLARRFPSGSSRNLRYDAVENFDWTPGFWVGMLWMAYEHTGDRRFRVLAETHLPSFRERLDREPDRQTHDLGFLFTLSEVAAYKLTADPDARWSARKAAELLAARYFEGGRIVQAWGRLDDAQERGRIIIDSAMNMPLLFWAAKDTGNDRYRDIACNHLRQVIEHLIREDGSTGHSCFIDAETGSRRYVRTVQGFSDDSCWSRGQAWAIYGFALGYQYTGEPPFLEAANGLADYFLDHLPLDGICEWDFDERAPREKDSSAAAIAASGLIALSRQNPCSSSDRDRYQAAARRILETLSTDYVGDDPREGGIVRHAVAHRPAGQGIDEYCVWGDYFYTEALMRLHASWTPYW